MVEKFKLYNVLQCNMKAKKVEQLFGGDVDREKLQAISFRIPEGMIIFLDYLADGVYIRDRTHALRLLLEQPYRDWLNSTVQGVERIDYIKDLLMTLFESDQSKFENLLDKGLIGKKKIEENEKMK